jgi:hypothetical protein
MKFRYNRFKQEEKHYGLRSLYSIIILGGGETWLEIPIFNNYTWNKGELPAQ